MRIFEPALRQLPPGEWSVSEPTSFQKYLEVWGFKAKMTAPLISVDSHDQLAPELREAGAMVLRLGKASDGPGTQFALIGTPGRLHDFFLVDQTLFTQAEPEVFQPKRDPGDLLPYSLMPKLTERSMVHLAFASGLIGYALGLDEPCPVSAPATGSGTYTFPVTPYPGAKPMPHVDGQVEIDAIFTGRRNGKDLIFVLESKMGPPGSLAKHKLVYPLLALESNAKQREIDLVPVYLRCVEQKRVVTFDIVECGFEGPISVTGLVGLKHMRIALRLDAGREQAATRSGGSS